MSLDTNDFEQLSYNSIFTSDENFSDNNYPDQQYFNDISSVNFDTSYISHEKLKHMLSENILQATLTTHG